MSLSPLPMDTQIVGAGGRLLAPWQAYFSSVHYWLRPVGNTGTTGNRPVDTSQNPLYIGQMYFDTSLGVPVWVKSRGPTVWVNASGTVM
jgi:hypothetical protein